VKNLDGQYVLVNQTFADMFHPDVKQVTGMGAAGLLEPEIAELLAEQDRAVLETGVGRSFEYSAQMDGTKHTFLTNKAPYRDANEKWWGSLG